MIQEFLEVKKGAVRDMIVRARRAAAEELGTGCFAASATALVTTGLGEA